MSKVRSFLALAILFGLALASIQTGYAQEKPVKAEDAAAVEEAEELPLSARQRAIFARYKRFHHTLVQMHQYMRKTDPDRADLLERTILRGRISQQLEQIINLLDQRDVGFGEVIDRQEELTKHLNALLDLLQSEDRLSDLEKEKKRIEALLKDVRELIGKEKVVRAQTERGGDTDRLAGKQGKVAEDTEKLGKKIDDQDAAKNGEQKDGDKKDGKPGEKKDGKPSDGKPKDGKPSDGKPSDGKPTDGKPSDGKPSEGKPGEKKPGDKKPGDDKDKKPGDKKPGEKKPGEKPKDGKPQDGKPQDGKPQDGKPQDGKPSDGKPKAGKPKSGPPKKQPKPPEGGENIPGKKKKSGPEDDSDAGDKKEKTPGREELEKAHAEMERAIEELKKKNRGKASEAEDKALQELIAAKEKLEEILRQLREEERELMLAALEARFRKMLAIQYDVLNGTDQMSKVSKKDWRDDVHRGEMQKLTAREQEIVHEADKALAILKAEGTSVAFPLAVEGIRDDVISIAELLQRLQDGANDPMDPFAPEGKDIRMDRDKMYELTIGMEKDVIAALKELIEALQKEMEKDKKDKDGKPKDSKGDPVLVDKLAELKMLRTLQMRVNRQTKRLGTQVDGEQATQPFIVKKLQQLAKLQAKIQKTAYDLATTRNQ
ncbi:MAG: hypothetical protein O3A00_02165 [Planctomycetota bacterium]|nr:hypothetical protein [Planctomycetota bacterium]